MNGWFHLNFFEHHGPAGHFTFLKETAGTLSIY
jgi:hypothetical protein